MDHPKTAGGSNRPSRPHHSRRSRQSDRSRQLRRALDALDSALRILHRARLCYESRPPLPPSQYRLYDAVRRLTQGRVNLAHTSLLASFPIWQDEALWSQGIQDWANAWEVLKMLLEVARPFLYGLPRSGDTAEAADRADALFRALGLDLRATAANGRLYATGSQEDTEAFSDFLNACQEWLG